MQNIVPINLDNTGGIAKSWFVPVEDVVSIPEAIEYTVAEPVVMDAEKNWYTIESAADTQGYDEKELKGKEGSGISIMYRAFIPGHNPTLTSIFNGMRHRRFLLIVKDQEDQKRLLGSLKNPMRFKYEFQTGNKTSASKGYEITFYQTAKASPFFYESPYIAYPDSISSDADFITLDAMLASLVARVTAVEDDVADLEESKLNKAGDTSTGVQKYSGDFSGDFDDLTLVPKEYVDAEVADAEAAALLTAIEYTDDEVAAAVVTANAYTDAEIAAALTALGIDVGNNVLFAATTGDDGTAVNGNLGRPYTPDGAMTAATSGDSVIIIGGAYAFSGNLAKSGVAVFTIGKVIINTPTDDSPISIDSSITEKLIISGDFEFNRTTAGTAKVIDINGALADVYIRGIKFASTVGGVVEIQNMSSYRVELFGYFSSAATTINISAGAGLNTIINGIIETTNASYNALAVGGNAVGATTYGLIRHTLGNIAMALTASGVQRSEIYSAIEGNATVDYGKADLFGAISGNLTISNAASVVVNGPVLGVFTYNSNGFSQVIGSVSSIIISDGVLLFKGLFIPTNNAQSFSVTGGKLIIDSYEDRGSSTSGDISAGIVVIKGEHYLTATTWGGYPAAIMQTGGQIVVQGTVYNKQNNYNSHGIYSSGGTIVIEKGGKIGCANAAAVPIRTDVALNVYINSCFVRKDFMIDQSSIDQVTVNDAIDTEPYEVTIDGVTYSHIATGIDTPTTIAAALVALINAGVKATALNTGPVIAPITSAAGVFYNSISATPTRLTVDARTQDYHIAPTNLMANQANHYTVDADLQF